jgi:hypothetical protein
MDMGLPLAQMCMRDDNNKKFINNHIYKDVRKSFYVKIASNTSRTSTIVLEPIPKPNKQFTLSQVPRPGF